MKIYLGFFLAGLPLPAVFFSSSLSASDSPSSESLLRGDLDILFAGDLEVDALKFFDLIFNFDAVNVLYLGVARSVSVIPHERGDM